MCDGDMMSSNEPVGEIIQMSPSVWRWTVKNCNQYFQFFAAKVSSPKFTIDDSTQTTNWQLHFYPSLERGKTLPVSVQNMDRTDVIAAVAWSVLEDGKFVKDLNSLPASKLLFIEPFSKTKLMTVEDRDHQNILALECCITVDPQLVIEKRAEVDRLAVLDDFEKLLNNSKHSDVTLVLPHNRQIYAHKNILSSRSSVFEAMFEHDMTENRLNTVRITDIKYKIVKELLRYIYTGKIADIEGNCRDLLVAADKYAIEGLKALCEKIICEQLNVNNALEVLQLATTYNAATLKSRAYDYIVKHIKDICRQPEFKHVDSEIKDELVISLADKI